MGVLLYICWLLVAQVDLTTYEQQNLAENQRWVAARRAQGESQKAVIGVMATGGFWNRSAVYLAGCLEGAGYPCKALDATSSLQGLRTVILPGGLAPVQYYALGDDGLKRLRQFCEGGGQVFGICAGAYLVSSTVCYDGIDYPYPLGLFDGRAEGPVAGLARYPDSGPVKVKVTEQGKAAGLGIADGRSYLYGGGPRFVGGTDVTVLMRYPDGTAACVRRKVGKGEVIALGIHVELSPKGHLEPSPEESPALLCALLGLSH